MTSRGGASSGNKGGLSAEGVHALLAATLESSTDFVGLTDAEGRFIFLNAAGRRAAGLAADADLAGISASTFHPPEVLAFLLADAIPVAIATGQWEGESTLRTLGGELIPVSLALVAHHGDTRRAPATAQPFHLAMIMRDLRVRARIENTLREGQDVVVTPVMGAQQRDREGDFLAAVLENLFEGVVACDAAGQLTLFNRATREFHGLPEVAIPPEEWAQHYALYNADGVTPLERDDVPLYRAFRGEDVHDAEMVIAPTGRPARTVRASGRPLRGPDGTITGAVVVMHDVTEHLKDLATQRQIEEQLRQSQKMEAVGQLAGGVAHDFNNLLTAITCSVDFLRAAIPAGHELRDDVDQIGDAAERAAALTRQLLAFGRREMIQPRRIDPGAVIVALTRLLTRALGPEVNLSLALDPAAGDVLADPSHLEQVLINLAINARDAMEDGGPLVIGTEARTIGAPLYHRHGVVEAGDYVLITVRDAGCGMDDATLARIFEPFFTTKGPGRGTGLGLATVFGIVTQSGGHVVVESTAGGGTTFTLFLPRLVQDGVAGQHIDGGSA